MPRKTRKRYEKRLSALQQDWNSWRDHLWDISEHLLTRGMRRDKSDRNKGTKRNSKIKNNTATRALRVAASGMQAGITSPARPWFKFGTPEPSMMEVFEVRQFLARAENVIRRIFDQSNVYNSLHTIYRNLLAFNTAAIFVDEDDIDVVRATVMPTGTYWLIIDERGRVSGCYREVQLTVEQLEAKFGLDHLSMAVQKQFKDDDLDAVVNCVHLIEENDDRQPNRDDGPGMEWRSVWFEQDAGEQAGFLNDEDSPGFREFPVMAPRWSVVDGDTYGSEGPGMEGLGDIKGLQFLERERAKAMARIVTPPMQGPASLKNEFTSLLPGDITYVPGSGRQKFEPAVTVDPKITMQDVEIGRVERRIEATFFVDLFLMLANSSVRGERTAREVDELHEEKMLQLGPVLERLKDELLGPLIDRTFEIALRLGMLGEVPTQLSGVTLRVELISVLAQAQKLVGTVSVERLMSFVTGMLEAFPEAKLKINAQQVVDHYAELLGTDPALVRPDEEVEQIEAEQERQIQQQQLAEQAAAARDGAAAAKDLSQIPTAGDNALETTLQNLGVAQAA